MKEIIKKISVDGVEYDIQAKELTKVTYAELREMRDNGELVEGHLYRITDYEFTTVQAKTKSAGHVFDIIVLATAANELSHIARAIAHEGDTYFDGNDLGGWELLYDLDNDTTKYDWADAENGKGVIYRMIDEKRNDCPYDFKNALFYNEKLIAYTTPDKYYYTFSYVVNGVLYDGTVEKQVTKCYGNSMGVYISNKRRALNRNVLRNISIHDNCNSNTFESDCYDNTLESDCYDNTLGSSCSRNTLGNSCNSNTFGHDCNGNTLGRFCYGNTLGISCYDNTLVSCRYNTLGNNIIGRKIDQSKTSITADEYYDDGSGQLVPVKHPDLSTQPSILPYKFMGQYVYEQLIHVNPENEFNVGGGVALVFLKYLMVERPIFLAAELIGVGVINPLVSSEVRMSDDGSGYCNFEGVRLIDSTHGYKFIHIIYTSIPEEGGDYYGYDNY